MWRPRPMTFRLIADGVTDDLSVCVARSLVTALFAPTMLSGHDA